MTNQRKIDIRTITADGPEIHFLATEAERQAIAKRFDIPRLDQLEVVGCFGRDDLEDLITFDGEMKTTAERECVITLKPFSEKETIPVSLTFSEHPTDDADPETDTLPIHKGKIDLLDVFTEEFGLTLNPFPKSVSSYLDYQDPDDTPAENPFAVLKKLK